MHCPWPASSFFVQEVFSNSGINSDDDVEPHKKLCTLLLLLDEKFIQINRVNEFNYLVFLINCPRLASSLFLKRRLTVAAYDVVVTFEFPPAASVVQTYSEMKATS
jgi:hypothetical protein